MQLYSPVPIAFRSKAKIAAGIMIMIGVLAILLPFYFGVFSMLIVGGAVLASGILGVAYNWQLRKLGVDSGAALAPWLFVLLGVLLLLTPKLTLAIAGLVLGASLIFSGVMGWQAEKRTGNPSASRQVRHAIAGTFGLIIVLSGASGAAWLIGLFFGLNMLLAGTNLWLSLAADSSIS